MEHRHFFIAGAQRCATTYLYRLFDQHPAITMASPVRPEPKYFIRSDAKDDADAYRRQLFARASTSWLGEKSTSYMEYSSAAERIARVFPDAELFFVLRDPVERAISNYRFSVMNGLETLSLEDALDAEVERIGCIPEGLSVSPFAYVGRGHYARQLDAWSARFPPERLHILTTERLVGDPANTLRDVFGMLGVDADVTLDSLDGAVNASKPTQGVSATVRQRLRSAFEASNQRLSEDFGVSVEDWQ
ncbi:sulfotransferase [Luteimonas sp. 50]|uniref:Sulfotransferase n=1 Tax=Cognatiluteimonas sedimenti TaxID=2927791 RepID=A0ABT0A6T0_9GAMM|nr:sulfotransferase [Lysobacter sedimenti]MCJ0826691.1 sulfotransferase [Lysobacter sedimenti]